jgi:N-sulfoglucosamine sulfohydrolase
MIDQLAEQGVRFDNYFCPAPQCSPSRGSILTGLYPHNNGLIGLAHIGFSLNAGVSTLPQRMKEAGYDTALIGFNHEKISGNGDSKHALGYETVLEIPGHRAEKIAPAVEQFLRAKADSSSDQPFYASVGFFETHRAFDEYEADGEVEIPPYLPDTEKVRQDMAQFHGSVKALDQAVGRIVRMLDETGLAENTLVIFTTDHGIAFPRAKGSLLDAGLETALIIRWPTSFKGGRVQQELLCNVDLMPTLLELIGAGIPDGLDGRSFLSVLEGSDVAVRESFYCEMTWHDRYHPMRGIRTNRYKYIHNLEDGPSVYLPLDIHRSLSGEETREQFYVPNVPEELYDLERDKLEEHNLAGDPAYAGILEELRNRVDSWMFQTDDPVLKGKVPGRESPYWMDEVEKGTSYTYNSTRKAR